MLPNVHETILSIDHDVTDLTSEVRFRLRHELVCTTSTSLITEDVKMTTNTADRDLSVNSSPRSGTEIRRLGEPRVIGDFDGSVNALWTFCGSQDSICAYHRRGHAIA